MSNKELADAMLASLYSMTDEDHLQVMENLVEDGIMDREGNVLVRVPNKLPDWIQPPNGHATIAEPKKPKRRRKST